MAAGGKSQNDQLFMRANAMSGAPIISGICQFARPVKAGMMAPNTMIRPCRVVNWLNSSGLKNCRPGLNSSRRMHRAMHAPGDEHDEGKPQVQGTDVLVVGCGHPARDASRVMIVMIMVDRAA